MPEKALLTVSKWRHTKAIAAANRINADKIQRFVIMEWDRLDMLEDIQGSVYGLVRGSK